MKNKKIGQQTIYIGSSEDMSGVSESSVNLFVTSPPYWNLKDYGNANQIGDSSYDEYLNRMSKVWAECYRVAADGAVLVINVNDRRNKGKFIPISFDIVSRMKDWEFWDHVIWYIPNALPQPNHYIERLLDNKYESCLVFVKGGSKEYKFNKVRVPQKYAVADPRTEKKNPKGRCVGNIIRIPAYRPPNIKAMGYHVAAYPEELAAFFIESYTNEGDIVLDPFLGSGTTLKVSECMKRTGIGFEINKDFVPLIEKRINEYWELPDWKSLDILHSATMTTGNKAPRKAQFTDKKKNKDQVDMELDD
jgi:DNA modification methylase